jgi:hypothetical protein
MRKPAELRAHLTAAVPELRCEPDKLKVFVTKGGLAATRARQGLSYEYRYTLRLQLWDYAGEADAVMVALLAWISTQQTELLDNPDKQQKAVVFEAEILNAKSVDLQVDVELTEAVCVVPRAGGVGWDITHLPEPDPLQGNVFVDQVQVYAAGELVAEWSPSA